ncbi:hypothetical protein EB796_006934 [Bugula neritina]|uniref:Uncharacterized protein n=1 Tax=Bugula neritina TaxID=10212 RepID=A0A7J7KA78_BUGNE|nr:hypothetical protein EB796_006934 [Bugula neritina]
MWGAENAMIWTFKYTLKWTVRNPCKVLSTYHKHCSRVHGPSLKDIGKSKYSILYLPGKNWTKTHFRQSIVRYENKLAYSP